MRFLTISLILTSAVIAYPNRAGQCSDSIQIIAEGMGGKNADLGWTLTASKTNLTGGDKIKITVGNKQNGSKFKGLLLYANVTGDRHIGQWDVPVGFITLDEQCKASGGAKTTLSHGNANEKSQMEFTWTAPANVGAVEIRGLIVTKDDTTWQQFKPLALKGNGTTAVQTPAPSNSSGTVMHSSFGAFGALVGSAVLYL
jgi:hypothetical protein